MSSEITMLELFSKKFLLLKVKILIFLFHLLNLEILDYVIYFINEDIMKALYFEMNGIEFIGTNQISIECKNKTFIYIFFDYF
jgi:hypothetical protein